MLRSIGRFSASALSHHGLSSAVCITNVAEIGHAPITSQLGWCEKARVRCAIFTHCGSPIVRGNSRQVERIVRRLGLECGVNICIAYDGLTLPIDPTPCFAAAVHG
jgi:hypothetical protein